MTDITERRKSEKKIQSYQKRLQALTSKLIAVEEEEKRRLARTLHDSIGQLLSVCKMRIGGLTKAALSVESGTELRRVESILDDMIQSVRSLAFQLGPPILYELELKDALKWLAEWVHKHYGIQIDLQVSSQIGKIGQELRTFLFRAAQELVTNVAKHAKTDRAKISLSKENESIRISVEDRGVGFDPTILDLSPEEDTGFGLFSIREHARHLAGQLTIQSKYGQGTQVVVVLPLKP